MDNISFLLHDCISNELPDFALPLNIEVKQRIELLFDIAKKLEFGSDCDVYVRYQQGSSYSIYFTGFQVSLSTHFNESEYVISTLQSEKPEINVYGSKRYTHSECEINYKSPSMEDEYCNWYNSDENEDEEYDYDPDYDDFKHVSYDAIHFKPCKNVFVLQDDSKWKILNNVSYTQNRTWHKITKKENA